MSIYHVAKTGSDSAAGTAAAPWLTIAKANQTLVAGDTVQIHAGEYEDLISPVNNGLPGLPITYTKYQNDIALVVGSGPDKPGVVCLGWVPIITGTGRDRSLGYATFGQGKNYIIVDGLHVSYKWSQDPTFKFTAGEARFAHIRIDAYESTGNIIRNNTIYQMGDGLDNYMNNYQQAGVLFCGNTCMIENNDIRGFWLGVWLAGRAPRNCTVRKNHIHDIGSSPIDCGSPESTIIQSTLIEDNVLGPSWNEDGIQFEPDYAHIGEVRNLGVVIRRNIFVGCGENSIDLKGAGQILIEDNVAYASPGQDNGGIEWDYALNKMVRDTTGTKYYTAADRSQVLINNRGGGAGFITLGAGENTKNVIIRNNIEYDNKNGIGPMLTTFKKFKVYNNTMLNGNRDFTGPNSRYGGGMNRDGFQAFVCYGAGASPDTEYGFLFKNNIIASHNDGEISLNLMGFDRAPSHQLEMDYNMYSNPNGVRICDPAGGVSSFYSFSAWKARAGARGYELHSQETPDIQFVNAPAYPVGDFADFDFNLKDTSPAKNAGTHLTHVLVTDSGTTVKVFDAEVFCDGYGVIPGDLILIGGNSPVRVVSVVDRETLVIDRAISWTKDDPVTLERLGFTPNIGATLKAVVPTGPPVFVSQPVSQTVVVGQPVTFWVYATGELPLVYQWKKDGQDIPGVSGPIYTHTPPLSDNGAAITCTATNVQGAAFSNTAILTVEGSMPPVGNIIKNPMFTTADAWWFHSDVAGNTFQTGNAGVVTIGLAGANVQLSQDALLIEAGKMYSVSFQAKSVPARSLAVYLHKNTAPYTNYGLSQQVNLTTEWATYSTEFVATEGSAEGRWRFWLAPFAQAGDVFSFNNVVLAEAGTPPVIPPTILVQPQPVAVVAGQPAEFSIGAVGTEPLAYQWQQDGQDIAGAVSSTLIIRAVPLSYNGASIVCAVANTAGLAMSSPAILTVYSGTSEYERGYNDGFTTGSVIGREEGYTAGYAAGLATGQAQGYTAGYEMGYSDGYAKGYTDGSAAGSGSILDAIFSVSTQCAVIQQTLNQLSAEVVKKDEPIVITATNVGR